MAYDQPAERVIGQVGGASDETTDNAIDDVDVGGGLRVAGPVANKTRHIEIMPQ